MSPVSYREVIDGRLYTMTDNPAYEGDSPPEPPPQHLKPGRNQASSERPPQPTYPPPRRPPPHATAQFQLPSRVNGDQRLLAAELARAAVAKQGRLSSRRD